MLAVAMRALDTSVLEEAQECVGCGLNPYSLQSRRREAPLTAGCAGEEPGWKAANLGPSGVAGDAYPRPERAARSRSCLLPGAPYEPLETSGHFHLS